MWPRATYYGGALAPGSVLPVLVRLAGEEIGWGGETWTRPWTGGTGNDGENWAAAAITWRRKGLAWWAGTGLGWNPAGARGGQGRAAPGLRECGRVLGRLVGRRLVEQVQGWAGVVLGRCPAKGTLTGRSRLWAAATEDVPH